MKFLFFLLLPFSAFAFQVSEVQVLGCESTSRSEYFNLSGEVDIGQSYLESLTKEAQKQTIEEHIFRQTKYWVGISKGFHSESIQKMAIAAYREGLSYKRINAVKVPLPEMILDESRGLNYGHHPYVQYLKNLKGLVSFDRFRYQVDVLFSFCGSSKISPSSVSQDLQKIRIPRDPFLGFWINTPKEKAFRQLTPALKGLVGHCLSDDYLIYRTSPDYSWFYWEPVQASSAKACSIERDDLVFQPVLRSVMKSNASIDRTISASLIVPPGPLKISIVFGALEPNRQPLFSVASLLADLQKILPRCDGHIPAECLTLFSRYSLKKSFEPSQQQLIQFIQYLPIFLKDFEISGQLIQDQNFLLRIKALVKKDWRPIELEIYYGSTGTVEPSLGPPAYWNFVKTALYESDGFFYFGHSGVGRNLSWAEIQRLALGPAKLQKRQKDLFLGIFNCEGYSYFGFDFGEVVSTSMKTLPRIHYVASSGVEANSNFMISYLQYLIDDKPRPTLSEQFRPYVRSRDFLVYQQFQ